MLYPITDDTEKIKEVRRGSNMKPDSKKIRDSRTYHFFNFMFCHCLFYHSCVFLFFVLFCVFILEFGFHWIESCVILSCVLLNSVSVLCEVISTDASIRLNRQQFIFFPVSCRSQREQRETVGHGWDRTRFRFFPFDIGSEYRGSVPYCTDGKQRPTTIFTTHWVSTCSVGERRVKHWCPWRAPFIQSNYTAPIALRTKQNLTIPRCHSPLIDIVNNSQSRIPYSSSEAEKRDGK